MFNSIAHLKRSVLLAFIAAAFALTLAVRARPAYAYTNPRVTVGCSQITVTVDNAVTLLEVEVGDLKTFFKDSLVSAHGTSTVTVSYGTTVPQGTSILYAYRDGIFTSGGVRTPCSDSGSQGFQGPGIPANFVLQTITCNTPLYANPGGTPAGSNAVTAGQTWYVNPVPVKDSMGKSWTEVFVSSYDDPFIPTSCLGGTPAK